MTARFWGACPRLSIRPGPAPIPTDPGLKTPRNRPQIQVEVAVVHVVGVGEMKVSASNEDVVVTHPLGSSVGISIYDPEIPLGGILHFMLPSSGVDPDKAVDNPFLFADTGIPAFLQEAYGLGASRSRLRIVLVGGAQPSEQNDLFAIGRRNQITARTLLWREEFLIGAEHLGGTHPRTLCLEVGSGRTWVKCDGTDIEL
jgi:chemotaxis protein CheD